MSHLPYEHLVETSSTPRNSVITLTSVDNISHVGNEHPDPLCCICKNKLFKKLESKHTPLECPT